MDELTNFIKTLDILYVEDDPTAREISTKIFKRFFNSVESCENGLDGYLSFQKRNSSAKTFDLIISDINMPKMSGLDMLVKIRELNNDIPVIFVTARNESDTLLKAIELQVINYIIKPIDIDKMIETIHKSCEKIFFKNMFLKKQIELETYLKTIEQITFIFKMNLDKKITYINDFFCENIKYDKNEIIDKNFNSFLETTFNNTFYEHINETISNGKSWEGVIKIKDKKEELIYLKSIIMPIFDQSNRNIIEYICISYSVTEDEHEKKELHKIMFQNIANIKKDAYNLTVEKEKQDEEIIELKKSIHNLNNEISTLNHSKTTLLSQIHTYEIDSLNQSSNKLELLKKKNSENENLRKALNISKSEQLLSIEKIEDLNHTINHLRHLIEISKANDIKHIERTKLMENNINELKKEIIELKNEKKSFF
jgi:CheY-like chemotaxis protein